MAFEIFNRKFHFIFTLAFSYTDFIIDTQTGEPNRLIISGLSGHGFKFSSVLGEIAAAFAQDKPIPFDLSPFSLSRFTSKS